jgi:hypothetical protein
MGSQRRDIQPVSHNTVQYITNLITRMLYVSLTVSKSDPVQGNTNEEATQPSTPNISNFAQAHKWPVRQIRPADAGVCDTPLPPHFWVMQQPTTKFRAL